MTGRLPPSSTERKCSSSGSLKHPFEPSLFEPKSPLPGNGIFRLETNGPKRRRSSRRGDRGDKTYSQNPANSGLIAGFGEISFRTRMRGGPGRNSNLQPSDYELDGLARRLAKISSIDLTFLVSWCNVRTWTSCAN